MASLVQRAQRGKNFDFELLTKLVFANGRSKFRPRFLAKFGCLFELVTATKLLASCAKCCKPLQLRERFATKVPECTVPKTS